jgi:hypothetical protein
MEFLYKYFIQDHGKTVRFKTLKIFPYDRYSIYILNTLFVRVIRIVVASEVIIFTRSRL